MPELPEVEIIKRSLFKLINNAKINDILIKNKNLRYKLPKNFSKDLVNQKILKISRRSKYLVLHFENKLLLIHLGMTGKLLILRKKDKSLFKTSFYYDLNILKKHNHVYFFLNNGLILIYNDVRRFGFFIFFFLFFDNFLKYFMLKSLLKGSIPSLFKNTILFLSFL